MIDPHGLARYWFVELFQLLANGYDDPCIAVLEELIETEERYGVKQAVSLLAGLPPNFVFTRPDVTGRLLDAARKAGPDVLDTMESTLISRATSNDEAIEWGAPQPRLKTLIERSNAARDGECDGTALKLLYAKIAEVASDLSARYSGRDDE